MARKKGEPNVRQPACALIKAAGHRILLDTPSEISTLLNRARVFGLSAVPVSHEHFDHMGRLIEFECWTRVLPIFAGYDVLPNLHLTPRFEEQALPSGFYSRTRLHLGDLTVMPFRVINHVPCNGFAREEAGT